MLQLTHNTETPQTKFCFDLIRRCIKLIEYFILNESTILLLFQVHVRNHIRSFPWMTSHFSRKDALQKRFLNPNLNIMWMYNLIYLEAVEPEVLEREKDIIRARQERRPIPEKLKLAVGEHSYRKVFNSEFNLRFGLPCLDTCATCDRLNLTLKSDPGAQLPISSWQTAKIRKTKGIKINYAGRQKRGR